MRVVGTDREQPGSSIKPSGPLSEGLHSPLVTVLGIAGSLDLASVACSEKLKPKFLL